MATQADVRRIALSFPGAVEEGGRFAFAVPVKDRLKGFAWVWLERIDPKKARVPQPKVLAVRTASLDDKEFILAMDPKKFFTEPHYNGYPAVLVRLAEIPVRELRPLLESAWRCTAPKALLQGQAPTQDDRSRPKRKPK
ncbi:MAG TPA: hypothetical protein VG817_11625 [Gemmatimonadales bacterium]|nr:hypothetical protein [Gemmatimonadales bacterium]